MPIENRLVRIAEVLDAIGVSRANFYNLIAQGLLPRPVKVSARGAALPEYEIRAVNAARIAGKSDDEVRALVVELHARRLII